MSRRTSWSSLSDQVGTPSGRVFSYGAGDSVGGGRLERIADDRVTIRRPEGAMEIMLRDSSKPASGPAPRPR